MRIEIMLPGIDTIPWSIKTRHYIIGDNFVKYEPFFTTFSNVTKKIKFSAKAM